MNRTIAAWIRHESFRRRLNQFYIALAVIFLLLAGSVSIVAFIPLAFISLFAGMSNVCMLLSAPRLEASDCEIRRAAAVGVA